MRNCASLASWSSMRCLAGHRRNASITIERQDVGGVTGKSIRRVPAVVATPASSSNGRTAISATASPCLPEQKCSAHRPAHEAVYCHQSNPALTLRVRIAMPHEQFAAQTFGYNAACFRINDHINNTKVTVTLTVTGNFKNQRSLQHNGFIDLFEEGSGTSCTGQGFQR